MKLKFKLTLVMIAIMVVVIFTISIILLEYASQLQQIAAEENMLADTEKYAAQVASHYQHYLDSASTLADMMGEYELIEAEERRSRFRDMLLSIFNANPDWVGIYAIWMPDTIDDMDREHRTDEDTDQSGAFIPWFTRNNGQVLLQPYNNAIIELGRMATDRRNRISDPTVFTENGVKQFAVNFSTHIRRHRDNAAVGIVGIQVNLEYINTIINSIKPYGVGAAGIVSANGTIVAHHNYSLVGTTLRQNLNLYGNEEVAQMEDALKTAEPARMLAEETLRQFYPFYIGEAARPWAIVTSVPEAVIMSRVYTMRNFVIIIAVIAIGIAGAIILIFISHIVTPIIYVSNTLKDISEGEGDLTKTITEHGNDEIADMAKYFNHTLAKIKHLVITIKEHSATLLNIGNELSADMTETAAAVNQITANIQSTKNQVINQSASVTETNATMEQITINIDKLNDQIEHQSASVSRSSSAIEEMLANIESVTQTLIRNGGNVQDLAKASDAGRNGLHIVAADIQKIARESEGLSKINVVMENIASQTNLLSMNAAIEAAHAGEYGKGFAVVASEIRKLAQSSSQQSRTISTVLKKIQESIDRISESTNNVLHKFEAIDSGVKTVSIQEENIRNAMEEQSAGSKQILESISQLNDATITVKSSSEEMLEGSQQVIHESKHVGAVTEEISNSMHEMAAGADQINIAIHQINTISSQNKDNINDLVREVAKFKVE
ncbi:methyl-accepting chemotaxis protein [Spirochaetia bacterium]|nr:methyl-accepting chemotaxis protein [Spirochaetia bacterium]